MGADVAVHFHTRREVAEEVVRTLRPEGRHATVQGNLASWSEAEHAVATASELIGGPVTIAVNASHPTVPSSLVRDSTDESFDAHVAGFHAHVNVCRAVLPGMRSLRRGRIVFVSGALERRPFPGFALYGAIKAASTAFSRTLALEEGAAGITVNVVAPGRLETAAGEAAFTPDPAYEALDEVTRLRVALPRMASPDDVATTVCFLASPLAEAITGQVVYLTAGEPM
jgi:3-oxoacyl-[acyl-carrier protein] reductase